VPVNNVLPLPKERKVQEPSRRIVPTLSHAAEQPYGVRGFALDLALGSVLFAITALTIFPLFSGEFTQQWDSIESAFLSDAIFVVNNYPHLGWYPFWYGGLPFHLSYTPLLPYLVAGLHFLLNWSVGHAYRVLTGLAYAATPVAFYALARSISKSRVAGLVAGFAYCFVPTFLPGLAPSHIQILTVYGEGPHTLALPFLLLAVLQLLRSMRHPTRIGHLATAALVAVVALANVIALFALALFALLALITEIVVGKPPQALRVFFLSIVISYGLVAFQYDLGFILASAAFGAGGGVSFADFVSGEWLPIVFVFAILVPGLVLMARHYLSKSERALILTMLGIVAFGLIVLSKQLFDISLVPQPIRYVPELDLSVSLLVGLVVAWSIESFLRLVPERSQNFKHGVRLVVTALVLVALVSSATVLLLPISLRVTVPSPSVADVPEFRMANWLSAHVTDERVYASGSIGFWLNVFSNVQQVRGGSDQGATNTWWQLVTTQINTGPEAELSTLLAQAWNVKYIVVTFPNASTSYHDYLYPDKFKNILPLRYYYQGFGVYEVPLSQPAVVQAVGAQAAKSLRAITDAQDKRDLSKYVNLMDSPPAGTRVTYSRTNLDQVLVSVSNASSDTAVLLKMTFDPRWNAQMNGQPVPISQIGPDFMIVYPSTNADYQITFHLERSQGELIGYFLSLATVIGVPAVIMVQFLMSRRYKSSEKETHPPA
jgi:hypothetical protein